MYGAKTEIKFNVSSSSTGWYEDLVLSYQQDVDAGLTKVTIERGELRKENYRSDYNQGTVNISVRLNSKEFVTNNITNSDAGKYITQHPINKSTTYTCDDNGATPAIKVECKVSFSTDTISGFNPKQTTYKTVGTIVIPNMDVDQKYFIKIGGVVRQGVKIFYKNHGVLRQVKNLSWKK